MVHKWLYDSMGPIFATIFGRSDGPARIRHRVTLAILTKLPTAEIRLGLHGFNQVLVMIALTSFVPLTVNSFFLAVLATVACSVIVMPALTKVLRNVGTSSPYRTFRVHCMGIYVGYSGL